MFIKFNIVHSSLIKTSSLITFTFTFMFRDVVTDTMRVLMTGTLELLSRPGRRRRGWTLPSSLLNARWVHVIGEVQDSCTGLPNKPLNGEAPPLHEAGSHPPAVCDVGVGCLPLCWACKHEIKIVWEKAKNVITCTFNTVYSNPSLFVSLH